MLKRLFGSLAIVLGWTAAAQASTAFPLGLYVGNPNRDDAAAMAAFKAAFDAHDAVLGSRPQYFDIFTADTGAPATWVGSAQFAATSAAASGAAYVGPTSGVTPVVGVPLGRADLPTANIDTFYRATIAGTYDTTWTGIVDAWAASGYKAVDFRIGYEMNGSFQPWSPNNSADPAANADYVAAFQHVADLLHSEATAQGITANVHWNPTSINYTSYDVTTLYPGDRYVDTIASDEYSQIYPLDLTDWSNGSHRQLADLATWAADPANRAHYYLYPNASQYVPTPTLGDKGWSLPQAIAFAKLHGKAFAIDETGVGPSGTSANPADDPLFVQVLAGILADAAAQGVTLRQVDIWDTTLSDGDWNFINGSKPLTAAAWARYFGSGSTVSADTVPEPTTWGMLIAGFAVVGGAMRRSRPVRAAIALRP